MHTLCQKWHVPICFLWWTWILATLESQRMSLIRWFFLLCYALWPSSRRAGCRSPGRRGSVTMGSVSTLSQWLCLGCDSWPISNPAAVVQWRVRREEFIFYARFWRCYAEQIIVPYLLYFLPYSPLSINCFSIVSLSFVMWKSFPTWEQWVLLADYWQGTFSEE